MIFMTKLKIIIISLAMFFSYCGEPLRNEEFKTLAYETEYVYSEKYALDEKTVLVNGEMGYVHLIEGQEKTFRSPQNEIVRIGTNKNNNYVGTLTGYGPDCYGCSKIGNVACETKNNRNWSLITDGIIYEDEEYGEVNIVAADNTLFPCGTIIEITNNTYNKLRAIVLDTGGTMRSKWRNEKKVYIDLAFETEAVTANVTSHETEYYVKRLGW